MVFKKKCVKEKRGKGKGCYKREGLKKTGLKERG